MTNLNITLTNPVDQARLDDLQKVIGKGPVLILTHDNPDPDALASGKALSFLFKQAWNIELHPVDKTQKERPRSGHIDRHLVW